MPSLFPAAAALFDHCPVHELGESPDPLAASVLDYVGLLLMLKPFGEDSLLVATLICDFG